MARRKKTFADELDHRLATAPLDEVRGIAAQAATGLRFRELQAKSEQTRTDPNKPAPAQQRTLADPDETKVVG